MSSSQKQSLKQLPFFITQSILSVPVLALAAAVIHINRTTMQDLLDHGLGGYNREGFREAIKNAGPQHYPYEFVVLIFSILTLAFSIVLSIISSRNPVLSVPLLAGQTGLTACWTSVSIYGISAHVYRGGDNSCNWGIDKLYNLGVNLCETVDLEAACFGTSCMLWITSWVGIILIVAARKIAHSNLNNVNWVHKLEFSVSP